MTLLNSVLFNLKLNSLIEEIDVRIDNYKKLFPDQKLKNLENLIPSLPLAKAVSDTLIHYLENLSDDSSFDAIVYSSEKLKLNEKVKNYYKSLDVEIESSEFFFHSNVYQEIVNILNLFDKKNTVALAQPIDNKRQQAVCLNGFTSQGNSSQKFYEIVYLENSPDNQFLPQIPTEKVDIIFLDLVNPITGVRMNKKLLQKWVDWAIIHKATIICNSSWTFLNQSPELPSSIYELIGSKTCCIEVFSSETMTGKGSLDFGWSIFPQSLKLETNRDEKGRIGLNEIKRMQSEALKNDPNVLQIIEGISLFSSKGSQEIKERSDHIMENSRGLKNWLDEQKLEYSGGMDTPFFWVKIPEGFANDWEYFDYLLQNYQIVCRPGSCFDLDFDQYVWMSGGSGVV